MKEITREMIEKVVYEKFKEISEDASNMIVENMNVCKKEYAYLQNEQLEHGIKNILVPTSTAYQMSMYMMAEVLCELLCGEEKEDESSNESNEIILDAGQSLTIKKGEHRIEINDNGVVVKNL